MILVWSLCKIYDAKTVKNTDRNDKIPMVRLVTGALLGALLAYTSTVNTLSFNDITLVRETKLPYLFYFVFLLIIGCIPMMIAYKRSIKNANIVYWFSFAAMCAPAGIVWFLVSLIMAICGKEQIKDKRIINPVKKQRKSENTH